MLTLQTLTLALILTIVLSSSSGTTSGDNLTAYEALQTYDFPVGILPQGALGYELDRSTGAFKAYLNGTCSFTIENSYQLKYKSTISGTISKDKLKNLTGVSVKILFLWLNIVEVTRNEDDLYFSVGIASASFEIDNFYESPQCGCGFDCKSVNNLEEFGEGKVKLKLRSVV